MEFQGEYRFLSNFWPAQVTLHEDIYTSVEHAYQAAKSLDKNTRARIRSMTPGQAKRFGRNVKLRPDWESVKIGIMLDLLKQKFQSGELRTKLALTKDMKLIEGNRWHDNYWGSCFCSKCKDSGKNILGRLLMWVRDLNSRD